MKTVTIKADDEFDALLSGMARQLKTTKSRVIRVAVREYQQYLRREELNKQMLNASQLTRQQAMETAREWDGAIDDGL